MARLSSNEVHIGILTAVYQRPAITEFCLSYMRDLEVDGVTWSRIAVTSEDDYLPLGWDRVHYENRPLGAKWNAGMRAMREESPDYILIMGSDDICNKALIEHYADFRPDFGTKGELLVFDSLSRRAIRLYRGRMGAGRFVSGHLLNNCEWTPWDDYRNKGLDRDLERAVQRVPKPVKNKRAQVLDIKSVRNIWSFNYLANNTRNEEMDPEEALLPFGLTPADIPGASRK